LDYLTLPQQEDLHRFARLLLTRIFRVLLPTSLLIRSGGKEPGYSRHIPSGGA